MTPDPAVVRKLEGLVDEALRQAAEGRPVDVQDRIAELAATLMWQPDSRDERRPLGDREAYYRDAMFNAQGQRNAAEAKLAKIGAIVDEATTHSGAPYITMHREALARILDGPGDAESSS